MSFCGGDSDVGRRGGRQGIAEHRDRCGMSASAGWDRLLRNMVGVVVVMGGLGHLGTSCGRDTGRYSDVVVKIINH